MAHQNHDFFDRPHKYENGSYVPVEYEHQEYPKNVDGVIVNNAEEEAALAPKPEEVDSKPAEETTEPKAE